MSNTRLIAVAAQEGGEISDHAGRALDWQVFSIEDNEPLLVWVINLHPLGCLHEWHVRGDGNRHPLHDIDIAIAASAGEGVIQRLAERNTQLITTSEKSPFKAVKDYLAGSLLPVAGHTTTECEKE